MKNMLEELLEKVKRHKIATGYLAALACVCIVFLVLVCSNENYIEFNVDEGTIVEVEYGTKPELPQITAQYKGMFFHRGGTSVEVTTEGEVDYTKLGSYTIKYSAKHESVAADTTLTVVVKDTQAPVITLVSNPEMFTSPIAQYQEEGFTAADNYDGDITARVVRVEENGIVTYRVADSSGNETTVQRTIVYKDAVAPVITLNGGKSVSIPVGGSYSEPGFSAADDCDGDITGNVTVEGQVDTQTAGSYGIVYKVADSSGNVCEVKRTVYVKNPVSTPTSSSDKTIYLTFDDGPGPYTQRLLDILDQYGVKATFFVTGANPDYYHMIGEAYRRGHTIALHTYSHEYSIYSSLDTYYADLQKIHDIVVAQTGVEPTLVRFPGGTSNTISKKYCQGIMTQLSMDLSLKGYQYYDWNVSSEDAGGARTEQDVFQNVVNQVSGKRTAIVLQHDIKKFSVEAVDNIIEWGLANGYTFKAMDENTPLIQHNPLN